MRTAGLHASGEQNRLCFFLHLWALQPWRVLSLIISLSPWNSICWGAAFSSPKHALNLTLAMHSMLVMHRRERLELLRFKQSKVCPK